MIEQIYNFAKSRNLEIGITTAEPFLELRESSINEDLKGFVEQDIQKRIYPTLTMKNAKSILVLAMPYQYRKKQERQELTGEFSIAAVGTDYHVLLKKHLEALAQLLQQSISNFEYQSFVDTGPLIDRALAVRAGLGWIGKNHCLHTQKFGSLIFIGYMMTNIVLEEKKRIIGDCGSCNYCRVACPTGALSEKFEIKKCISYLTQTKTVLPTEVMKTMGKQLYGCDVCQIVCPKNQKVLQSLEEKNTSFSLEELLYCSNKDFMDKIGKTAAGWRGKKILQRNAIIALGNSKNEKALPLLQNALQDKRELIQQTALKAIYNFNNF